MVYNGTALPFMLLNAELNDKQLTKKQTLYKLENFDTG
jgi:hypothetical protein